MQVCSITDLAVEAHTARDAETREKAMDYMTTRMFRFLQRKGDSQIRGNDLLIVYLIFKLVYMSHMVFQIFLLNMFLGSNYANYGLEVLRKLLQGADLMNSKRFPRVTMCDFRIRLLGNLQRYTVQCALPINLYNEIIFIFIWFWFVMVTVVSGYSFCFFLWKGVSMRGKVRFVEARVESGLVKRGGGGSGDGCGDGCGDDGVTRLNPGARDHYTDFRRNRKERVRMFVREELKGDGVFLLRMVAWNSSGLIAVDLVTRLWDIYTGKTKPPEVPPAKHPGGVEEEKNPLLVKSMSIS